MPLGLAANAAMTSRTKYLKLDNRKLSAATWTHINAKRIPQTGDVSGSGHADGMDSPLVDPKLHFSILATPTMPILEPEIEG